MTALDFDPMAPPHLELLRYRSATTDRAAAAMPSSNDIAATRLALDIDLLPDVVQRLVAAEVRFISAGTVTLQDGHRPH